MSVGFLMHLFMNDFLHGCLLAFVVIGGHPKTFIVQLTLGNKVVINSLSLLILQRRSRPRSVRDCDNHSEASTDVNIFLFVEPVSKSKDYARSWIRIGSVSRVPVMVDIHPPPPPPPFLSLFLRVSRFGLAARR